jgi:hypothetical protein
MGSGASSQATELSIPQPLDTPVTVQTVKMVSDVEIRNYLEMCAISWTKDILRTKDQRSGQMLGYFRVKDRFAHIIWNNASKDLLQMLVRTMDRHMQGNSIVPIIRFILSLRKEESADRVRGFHFELCPVRFAANTALVS